MTDDPHLTRLLSVRVRLGDLNPDELEAIEYLLSKLLDGKTKHGPLVLDRDPRNWSAEDAAELADSMFYRAFRMMQLSRMPVEPPVVARHWLAEAP